MRASRSRGSFNLSGLKRRLGAVFVAALVAVPAVLAVPAMAQTVSFSFTGADFSVPRPVDQTDQEGVRRLLTTFDLAANGYGDLIGRTCTFSVAAANGQSVHLNNFGVIATGVNETDVLQTESLPNVVETVLQDATLVLGATIELYNVMVPDANGIVATSVDYSVTATCTAQQTTTTTSEATTTTSEATTTTSEATTTTSETTTTTSETTTTTPETTPTDHHLDNRPNDADHLDSDNQHLDFRHHRGADPALYRARGRWWLAEPGSGASGGWRGGAGRYASAERRRCPRQALVIRLITPAG